MSVPRFLAKRQELAAGRVRLHGAPLRHLRDVLRLTAGGAVELFDGEGGAFAAEILTVGPSAAELRVLERIERLAESPAAVTLAVALAKGSKIDWVVEKATELGVARVVPFRSERTIPDGESFSRRAERLCRIAAAAAAQCGRARTPEIAPIGDLASVLRLGAESDRGFFFWEGSKEPVARVPGVVASVLVVTGPEGGFSDAEAAAARAAGLAVVGLGPRVLRAETASIAALVLAQHLFGDLGPFAA